MKMPNPFGRLIRAVKAPGRYLSGILLAMDRLGNALLAGDDRETIRSRIGRKKLATGGVIPWSSPVSKIVDAFLEFLDEDHTIEAIEDCSCAHDYPNHDEDCPLHAKGIE